MQPMNQTIAQLHDEISTIHAEIATLQGSRDTLRQSRLSFRGTVNFPEDHSPEALAKFQQQNAALAAKWQAELKEIDRQIKTLEIQLQQKEAQLVHKQKLLAEIQLQEEWRQLEIRVQAGGKRLQAQANKINQLAAQLEVQIQTLKEIYDEVNPSYCEWLQKPGNIVEFSAKTLPHVFIREGGFELVDREINWNGTQGS